MRLVVLALILTCIPAAAVTAAAQPAAPLPGMVDIAPEHAMDIPRAERPGAVFGIVLEDGSVLTTPSHRWTGAPLRITSLTSDAIATVTRVLDWSLDDHWVLLDAEWRTGAPVAADLGPAPVPGDPLRICAVRDSGRDFQFLEPRRLRPSRTRAPSLLHSANVIFKQPRAAMGAPVVNDDGQIVGLVGSFATDSGARLKLSLVPIRVHHQATLRIATIPHPLPEAEPLPLADFAQIARTEQDTRSAIESGREALEAGRLQRAADFARLALEHDPRCIAAWDLAAEVHIAQDRWTAAINILTAAIPRQARPLRLQGLLARALLGRGERGQAVALARRIAAEAAAQEVTALERAAHVLEQADLAPEAVAIWGRILEAFPRHSAAAAALDRLDPG